MLPFSRLLPRPVFLVLGPFIFCRKFGLPEAPVSRKVAFQRMEPISRQIEVLWPGRFIEPRQHAGDFAGMLRIGFAPVVVFIKAFQARRRKCRIIAYW